MKLKTFLKLNKNFQLYLVVNFYTLLSKLIFKSVLNRLILAINLAPECIFVTDLKITLTANIFESGLMPPHENFQQGHHCFQVVNQAKTKPRLAGNQIPFGGTRLDLVQVSNVYNRGQPHSIMDTHTKSSFFPPNEI